MTVDARLYSGDAWTAATPAERAERGSALAAALGGRVVPSPDTTIWIERDGVTFALVPGGTTTLGWDPARPHGMTEDQVAAVNGEEPPFEPMLAYYLSETRTVTLAPFLLEVAPRDISEWVAELDEEDLLAAIAARIGEEGYRLPTDDEWEHAARGATKTMFRWGDTWPDGVPYGKETTFTGHQAPNALGLVLLHDPYKSEVVDGPLGFRGGDGGQAVCGGRPAPEAWYTFASAFRPRRELWEDIVAETLEQGYARRALSIDGKLSKPFTSTPTATKTKKAVKKKPAAKKKRPAARKKKPVVKKKTPVVKKKTRR